MVREVTYPKVHRDTMTRLGFEPKSHLAPSFPVLTCKEVFALFTALYKVQSRWQKG